jgi:hypothetical protein
MKAKLTEGLIRVWKKVAAVILIFCATNALLAWLLKMRYADLLFMEGILVFAAGAYIASGVANLRRETYGTMIGDPEGHKEFIEKERSKQVADGILLMTVGATIVVLSMVFILI